MNNSRKYSKENEEMNRLVEVMMKENKEFYYNEFLASWDEDANIVIEDEYIKDNKLKNDIIIKDINWLRNQEVKEVYYIDIENLNLMLNDGQHLEIHIL
jgi:hypothetical protein